MKRKHVPTDEIATYGKKLKINPGGTQLHGDQKLDPTGQPDEATTLSAQVKELEHEVQIIFDPDRGGELTRDFDSCRRMRHP
jgi:hypothetical protein